MKRLLLYLLALAPMAVSAQIASGFYRVQNNNTSRFISIVDTYVKIEVSGSAAGNVIADLDALYMIKDFEEKIAFNPATICYLESKGDGAYNLTGQGLDLYAKATRYLYLQDGTVAGTYQFYAEGSGAGLTVKRFLIDNTIMGDAPSIGTSSQTPSANWKLLSVDPSNSEQYFGVKPDVTASIDGSYWATMYAGFPFKPFATDTKVYTVTKVDNAFGVAVIKEVTEVPAQTPVLFRCGSSTPSGNKLTLLPSVTADLGANCLNGNYYCNDVAASTGHRNVTNYDSSTMRMLGTTADGKPAFVKSNITYLPANKCYLKVNSAPDELLIMTQAEYDAYVTGIDQITTNEKEGEKVIYDLQGRRVQAPTKGVYIVNGKKVVIK